MFKSKACQNKGKKLWYSMVPIVKPNTWAASWSAVFLLFGYLSNFSLERYCLPNLTITYSITGNINYRCISKSTSFTFLFSSFVNNSKRTLALRKKFGGCPFKWSNGYLLCQMSWEAPLSLHYRTIIHSFQESFKENDRKTFRRRVMTTPRYKKIFFSFINFFL